MRNRWLAMLLAGLLVAAACGRGDVDQLETQSVRTTPSAAEEDANGAEEEPDGDAEQQTAPPDDTTPAPAAPQNGGQQAPPPPGGGDGPAPGTVAVPKIGDYVYAASGTDQQGNSQEGEYTSRVAEHNPIPTGTEVVTRVQGGQQGGQTTRMWWEDNRILLTRMTFTTPQGSLECNFAQQDGTPGLIMAKFPVRAETYPKQEWQDRNCSGSLELTYERQESIDAAGRSWDTWRAKFKLVINMQVQMGPGPPMTVTVTQDGTRWLSAELGTDVREESTQEFRTPQGTGSGQATRTLKSHP